MKCVYDWRSKLRSDTLTSLLTVKLQSSDIDNFDPSPAFNQWLISGSRKRRPGLIRSSTCRSAASNPLPGTSGASLAETASLTESESECECVSSVMLESHSDSEASAESDTW
jgi:hypothetical protein